MLEWRYLESKLHEVRYINKGEESIEEDDILDAMDDVWYDLSEEEWDLLRQEGIRPYMSTIPDAQ